jgi:DNA-binding NarL/FixJ family response regulator
MPRARVLLAEDHAIVAEGLRALLQDKFDLVGIVHDGRALLTAVDELRPDVVIADISMPLLNGVDAVKQIQASKRGIKVIMLTMHADVPLAVAAFRAGASGYVLKSSAGDELIAAVEEVLKGRSYLTPLIAKDVLGALLEGEASAQSQGKLTPRQREVLQLIAEGHTMKEVASILHISTRTAESHKYEMMNILGVTTTAELIQCAIRLSLITLERL